MAEEFGVTDLTRLPEFHIQTPTVSQMTSRTTITTTSTPTSLSSPSSPLLATRVGQGSSTSHQREKDQPRRHSIGPPSSLLARMIAMTPATMKQPSTTSFNHPLTPSGGPSASSSSDGFVTALRSSASTSVTTHSAAKSSSSSGSSTSTPSPRPTLKSKPLVLNAIPPKTNTINTNVPGLKNVASNTKESAQLVQPSVSTFDDISRPKLIGPPPISTFEWQLPSSIPSILSTPSTHPSTVDQSGVPSLTLQCEQVRSYLEQHIPMSTLQHAYQLLVEEHGNDKNPSNPRQPNRQLLQLIQLSQTHLLSLIRQLVEAEYEAEQQLNHRIQKDKGKDHRGAIQSSANAEKIH